MPDFLKNNWLLGFILLAALAMRLLGIGYNLPLVLTVGDESTILYGSMKMLANHTPFITDGWGPYFVLNYYLFIPFLAGYIFYLKFFTAFDTLAKIKALGVLQPGHFLIAGRLATALLGTASVFLIYLISRRLFGNKRISLIAASLFAVSPMNVVMSHFARVWEIQVFFVLLAVYFAVRFLSNIEASRLDYKKLAVLGIVLGLAFGVLPIGLFVYLPILVLAYYSFDGERLKNFGRFLISRKFIFLNLILFSMVILEVLLNVYGFQLFLNSFLTNVGGGHNEFQVNFLEKTAYFLKVLWRYETAIFLLSFPAFYFLFRRPDKKIFRFLLGGFLSFYIFFGPLGGFVQERYALPMVPFLCLAAAYLIEYVWQKSRKVYWPALFLAAAIMPGFYVSVNLDRVLLKNGTDLEVYDWIRGNIPAESKILFVNNYFLQDLILTKESILKYKNFSPDYFSSRMDYLLNLPERDYPGPAYDIYQYPVVCEWNGAKDFYFDYVVAGEWYEGEFIKGDKIDFCGRGEIELKKENIIFESEEFSYLSEEYLNKAALNYTFRPCDYFSRVNKLGRRFVIYKLE